MVTPSEGLASSTPFDRPAVSAPRLQSRQRTSTGRKGLEVEGGFEVGDCGRLGIHLEQRRVRFDGEFAAKAMAIDRRRSGSVCFVGMGGVAGGATCNGSCRMRLRWGFPPRLSSWSNKRPDYERDAETRHSEPFGLPFRLLLFAEKIDCMVFLLKAFVDLLTIMC
jgi:hypothetical protein